ncbi:pectinesterase family protein [Streptomyces arenae]|uniref:pectinesterase family protein n=1 Tax=Streptomyces arenae TaxID=29301 RepID=UPI002659DB86|nr:pectinesterase family protein [Streptomyces arenae]MCG7210071.1 pectinesterase family protein [Streptomyces arenae]
MIASTLSAVLFWVTQPASALVEDYRAANWNMQGAQNQQDNKWQSGVRALINAGHNVIALQEAGQAPASAGSFNAAGQWVSGQPDQHWTFLTDLRNGAGYTVYEYEWRPNGTRGDAYYIYFMQTDFGANRVNLAIVTHRRADAINVARPFVNANTGTTGRPALGIRLDNTYFWSVHASASRGYDAAVLLENIDAASNHRPWAALGDFNREPQTLQAHADQHNLFIYSTGQVTHYGGSGNNRELDYMVTNELVPGFTPGTTDLGSDHRAVFYYTLRANADVQIRVPSFGNATLAGDTSEDDRVRAWAEDTSGWPDVNWRYTQVQGSVVTIKNDDTGLCLDASDTVLRSKSCNGSTAQQFYADLSQNGLLELQPFVKPSMCVAPVGRLITGLSSYMSTTASCGDPGAHLGTRYNGDPGSGAAPAIFGHLQVPSALTVAADGSAQYRTVQDAINAVPADGNPHTIVVNKGTYHEVVNVPSNLTNLTIKGATGNPEDVNITYGNAHGMTNPATSQPYGTDGSATATFKPTNLRVQDLTITNSFDPSQHPEIDQFSTQAVALLARGDRQVYTNVRLIGRQDTVEVKSPVATDQTRQYFRNVYVQGSIDFIFGNATAVFDHANIGLASWPGGTITAPNTDQAKQYGILITNSTISSSAGANTMYLGRPWHSTTTAQPQAVIRDSSLPAAITAAQPWTNMDTTYTWQQARFFEYHNSGAGAGVNSNRPQLTDAQAGNYTAQKYLAGTDGWNPTW